MTQGRLLSFRSHAMRILSAFTLASRLGGVGAAAALFAMAAAAQTSAPAPTGLPVVPAVPAAQPLPANRWTAPQIRQAFETADADSNGGLSRSEAQRLAIAPKTFEEMDLNKDGVVSRAEYEAAFVR
jgi:hypothetical protein